MEKSESIPVMSVSGLNSPPAWRTMRAAAQNPVTPANTPVLAGVFAKHPVTGKKTPATNNTTEEEVTEKMKTLGQ